MLRISEAVLIPWYIFSDTAGGATSSKSTSRSIYRVTVWMLT
ncbi:MAG: hypothetical protein ACRERU_10100 [Methylococcales bacterium]